jgi:uncharacterized membrane protein
MFYKLTLYLMALVYVLAGMNHFRAPQFYMPMMPPWIPAHQAMIIISGLAEIILGLLLFYPPMRALAAWGVIALLVAVFPVHIYMYQARETVFSHLPNLLILARIPLQFILMYWAYIYTRV